MAIPTDFEHRTMVKNSFKNLTHKVLLNYQTHWISICRKRQKFPCSISQFKHKKLHPLRTIAKVGHTSSVSVHHNVTANN
jgi:hypothetical protein